MQALPSVELVPLLTPEVWARLLRLCEQFPVSVQTVCFECRLGELDPRVDLAFSLMPGPEVPALAEAVARAEHSDRAWTRFADFLSAWDGLSEPWSTLVPFVCPAFDLPAPDEGELPPPCLSVCVDPDFYLRRLGVPPLRQVGVSELLALAEDCHRRLTGVDIPAATRARLGMCLDSGYDVVPKHMSWMLSRAESPMKLDVRLHTSQLARYLTRIAWPGDIERLTGRVAELVRHEGWIQLNLVLHPGLTPPLEVELYAGADDAPTVVRLELLERLVTAGLASRAKADRLSAAWLNPTCQFEPGRTVAKSWYLKLRFGEVEGCDAKAYFGLVPRIPRL